MNFGPIAYSLKRKGFETLFHLGWRQPLHRTAFKTEWAQVDVMPEGVFVLSLGVGFGLVAVRGLDTWATGIALGLGYGVVWWVLGALLIMPAQLGMPVLGLSTMAWQSLAGHLVFGAVLGAVVVAVLRGSRETQA